MESIDSVRKQLSSSTLKQRREGVKVLDTLLDSPVVLNQLDANTAKLWPEDKLTYSSWPGIVNLYLGYVDREVLQHNKQLDSTALRVLRKIFAEADNTDRCVPGTRNLLRIAGFIFDKIKHILASAEQPGDGLSTPLGKEWVIILQKALLPQQHYCQRSNVAAFQGIIEEVMCRFETLQRKIDDSRSASEAQNAAATAAGRLAAAAAAVKGRSSEVLAADQELHSMCGLLVGLLSGVPGQLNEQFAADTVAFCVQGIQWFGRARKFGKPELQLLSCLNGLLLMYGQELRPIVGPSCYSHLTGYIKQAWGERNSRLKESVLCFCRVCLCLGGPQYIGPKAMEDLQQLVVRDIQADGFVWDLQNNKQHQLLAALAASLYYQQIIHTAVQSPPAAAAAGPGPSSSGATSTAAAADIPDKAAAAAASGGTMRRRSSSSAAAAAAAGSDCVSGDDSASEDEQLPRKRSRMMEPDQQLLLLVERQPERWGPVLALLLHLHGPLLPVSLHTAALNQLSSSIRRLIQDLTSSSSQPAAAAAAATLPAGAYRRSATPGPASAAAAAGGVTAAVKQQQLQQLQLSWVLRCLTELALCWPAGLRPAAAAAASSSDSSAHAAPGSSQDVSQQSADHAAAAAAWQLVWDSALSLISAAAAAAAAAVDPDELQRLKRLLAELTEPLSYLLHVLVARYLIKIPSRTVTLGQLLPLLLQKQQQQLPRQQQHDLDDLEQQQQQEHSVQYLPLLDPQLALLITVIAGEKISNQSEAKIWRQLLLACLTTAETCCCSSSRASVALGPRSSSSGVPDRAIPTAAAAAMPPGSSAAAAGICLPELLLPAALVLLGCPGLPTPGLNGAPGAYEIAATLNPGYNTATAYDMAALLNPGKRMVSDVNSNAVTFQPGAGCNVIWYNTDTWWGVDPRAEVLFQGLDNSMEYLKRKIAATQMSQVLTAAAAAASSAPVLDLPSGAVGSSSSSSEPGAAAGDGSWKCWCALADWTAERLSEALAAALPDDDQDQQQQQQQQQQHDLLGSGSSSSSKFQYPDPTRQLCHLLLLSNMAANLPCLAAVKCAQLQINPHQQQQQRGVWCGVGFSGLPGLHIQLQQLMIHSLEQAGDLLRAHLSEYPCAPATTWTSQLQHLGSSLARLQRLTDTFTQQQPLPAAAAASDQQQQQAASSQQIALAVAAGVLQPVVLALQKVVSDAAAAAVAAASDPQFRKARTTNAGDIDLDDDFIPAPRRGLSPTVSTYTGLNPSGTPAPQGFAGQTSINPTPNNSTQGPGFSTQGGGFSTQNPSMGPPASKPHAGTNSGPPGYVTLMAGGLAGFSGRTSGSSGFSVLTPILAGFNSWGSPSGSNPDQDVCGSNPATGQGLGFRQGFATGGLDEGLAGLGGPEGAGLRVLAALSPACGPDAAQGLLQLWRHVSGVGGGAPSESLLEGLVETMTAAVCAGGWLQLGQLFGMIQGSHALLSPSKVSLSTLHLLLRSVQAVAVATAAAGVDLSGSREGFMAAMSQGSGVEAMEVDGVKQGSLIGELLEIFDSIHTRIEKFRTAGEPVIGHNPLPQATQLQLAHTILSLLLLLPEHAYGSNTTAAAAAAAVPARAASTPDAYALSGSLDDIAGNNVTDLNGVSNNIDAYRTELLDLLDCGCYNLRMRAGPLIAQLVAGSAAAAATPGSSVTAAVRTALVEISRHLQLQTLDILTEDQQIWLDLIRSHPISDEDTRARLDAVRASKTVMLRWETAITQVADLAAATLLAAAAALRHQEPPNTLDASLLLLLLGHSAVTQQLPAELLPTSKPSYKSDLRSSCLDLAAAAADLMAVQQQYPDRFSYLRYHAAAVLWQWFGSGKHTFEQLTLLLPLLCPTTTPAAAAAAPAAAVLDRYGSEITMALMHNIEDDQQLAAAAAGLQLPVLLEDYKIELYGTLLPLSKYLPLRSRVARLAEKAGKTPRTTISSRLVLLDGFFRQSLPAIINPTAATDEQQQQENWGAAADKRDLAAVYYPQPVAKQACKTLAEALSQEEIKRGDLSENDSWFIKSHLRPRGLQALMLQLHRHITTAAHPVHKLQRLGQIELLLRLLQPTEITTPAVARYLITILLQHVQTPALQPACCDWMEFIIQQLYQAAAAAAVETPSGGKSSKAVAAAAAATASVRQQLAAAILVELLPATVAVLVQCVEAAAAALQQQQRQVLWSSPSRIAQIFPTRSYLAGSGVLDLPEDIPCVNLLLFLMRDLPQGLLPVISTLDMLPPLPVLAAAAALQQQQQRELKLPQRIIMVADRIGTMAVSSRQRSIQAISHQLQHNSDELYAVGSRSVIASPQVSSSSSFGQQQQQQRKQVDPAVTAAAYKLAHIGAESGDRVVTALAAQLLAISGPLDPDITTFSAAASSSSSSSISSSSASSDSTDLPMIPALRLLVECLFDSHPHVVGVAQTAITQLLATDDGKAALQMLLPGPKGSAAAAAADRSLLFSYLQIFTDAANIGLDKKPPQQRSDGSPQAAAAALAAATSADLWSPLGKTYDSWLCAVSSTLLAACGAADGAPHSRSLQLLAAAAALRPQLAELLLPHALLLLASSDGKGSDVPGAGSSGLAARLGAAISQGLNLGLEQPRSLSDRNLGQIGHSDLDHPDSDPTTNGSSSSSSVDTRCLNTLLVCLEHNMFVHRKAMMALITPQQEPQPPTTWHRCYCLHIDYLAVAAAAMACKAYFTALIYIEFWCEEQYGKLSYSPNNTCNDESTPVGFSKLLKLVGGSDHTAAAAAAAGSVQQQQRQLLEDLLLDLYSNVNEPDGIYAVAAAFSSSACQLQLLRQEQQWDKVLGAEDAMLQAAAVEHQQHQRQSAGASSAGVLSALQLLGCQATARQCLQAALNTSSSQQQQQQQLLLDMQYELAWRLSDWGIESELNPDHAGSSSSRSCGHQMPTSISRSVADSLAFCGSSSSSSFNACVLAALEAMQACDQETFSSNVSNAQHDCIMQLARSSTQSAAALNPILVQLRMCHMLQMGMEAAAAASPAGAAAGGGVTAAEHLLQKLLGADQTSNGRSAAADLLGMTRYHLSDQIQSAQAAISKVLRRPDALALTLQAQASTARQSGQINFASAALNQLQKLLHAAAAAARPGTARLPPGKQQQQLLPSWLVSLTSPEAEWVLESVRLKWLQGQQLPAFRELQGLISALQQQQQQQAGSSGSDPLSKVRSGSVATALMLAQAQAGEWMAVGQFSNSSTDALTLYQSAAAIAQQQQQSAVKQFFNSSDQIADLHCQVFFQLATYADQRFREIELQMASPEWQKQLKVLESKRAMLHELEAHEPSLRKLYNTKVNPKSASAAQVAAQYKETMGRLSHTRRTVAADADVVEQRAAQRTQCLKLALSNYRACIAAGNSHDLQVVYRLCSLWFRHWSDPAVNAELAAVFDNVPSAKFVPLVYQIASRLDTSSNIFQAVLNTALTRLCTDHPYHTLYSLIALKNGSHGKQTGAGGLMEHQTDLSKVEAANALLQSIKTAQNGRLKGVVNDMNDQVQVFIDIHSIMANVPRDARGCVNVASCQMPGQFRRKLQDFKHAPPICLTLEIDPTCRYQDVPHVVTVDNTIDFCGGINSPMVTKTVDSTGRRQRQLAKSGNDDLRQDAVMQQFFGLVNALLASSPASRQRRLGIRTYRVVPCSPTTGVLEWVEGTKPMTDYLAEGKQREGGALGVYRKAGNLTWFDCYMELQKLWNAKQFQLLKTKFLEVCARFPPVFHNFFLESFPDPAKWFEARTLYTRSTAASSMAGYVVGLGDRHMGNILLDMGTAEVVHIDLGIAFEQGMFLNTPERVPFRLTANVVDGMGAAGVEGPFRRCCETTLEVLRSHKEALLTVVEVVLHDPLYKWQMTTIKAQRKQQDPLTATGAAATGSGNSSSSAGPAAGASSSKMGPSSTAIDEIGNADAERAVLRVKQKLEGQDVEGGAALSVAAQVGVLLAAAQDPDNLSRMFIGWAAWM